MRAEHRDIQKWIKQQYSHKYTVEAEIDRQNYLPDRKRHWYQPDVILRNRKNEISHIIEVENDPVRKVLVGASILADYSIKELAQHRKPRLIFVVYTQEGIRQISNFLEKIKIATEYCHHLAQIEIYSESDFKSLSL